MATRPFGFEPVNAALVTLLSARIGLAGVNVGYQPPQKAVQVLAESGQRESIYFGDSLDGELANVVFCDGGLRFDATYIQELFVLVVGKDSGDTQQVVDGRADVIVGEIFAELANQQNWSTSALGLDGFGYMMVTPAEVEKTGGRIGDKPYHGCLVELGLQVEARWRPPT